jgi:ParB-like chromosome segregation protein Spo0J
MKILQVPVADLSHDPANARKHPERNLDTIVASLRRFGLQKPIVIDRNNIVRAGNGTLEAAKRLGWEKIDCVLTELNGADATAYAIADNRTAELAEWDDEILTATLNGLALEDGLLEAAGYDEEELAAILNAWEPDFDPTEKDGTNLDGIKAKVVVEVDQDHQSQVKAAIEIALKGLSIAYEVR